MSSVFPLNTKVQPRQDMIDEETIYNSNKISIFWKNVIPQMDDGDNYSMIKNAVQGWGEMIILESYFTIWCWKLIFD